MYRIDGGDQKGRNDAAKLGFLTLEIYETGHVAHYHRSYGATLAKGGEAPEAPAARPHIKTATNVGLMVDLRRSWAEEMVVAPSGAVDEFQRKLARNDYPLMALWEMGLRGLRVPFQDLADPRLRGRMQLMTDVGHRFQVYLYGLPSAEQVEILTEHAALVGRIELVVNWRDIGSLSDSISDLKSRTGCRIVLSRVNRKDGSKHSGSRFNHLISHGFTLGECDELKGWLAANPGLVDGPQFTIMRAEPPWSAAAALATFAGETGVETTLYVKSNNGSPAESFEDEAENGRRFIEAAMAQVGFGIGVILDTLEDADRGYFVRTGLIDRRFNPRAAGERLAEFMLATQTGTWQAAEGDTPAIVDEMGKRLTIGDYTG
jgi:hypothetical protein